jgi:CubicO group peptidase (beta-lactamase class C family)
MENSGRVGGNMKQRNYITGLLTLLALISSICFAQAQSNAQVQIDFSALEEVIQKELTETGTPGAAIGIVKEDRLIYAKGFGVSNIETGAAVTPETLFRLGSTTKMFTAATLVVLAEQGKIKLDEPIGKYAKGLSPKVSALTGNQLLSHLAGLKDNATMYGKHDDEALGETVRALKDDFFFAEPGQVYSYSNPGFWLAGYLIETVGGKAYADQMEESLFKPLGMRRTTFRPTLAMTYPLAQGHEGAPPKIIRPAADNAGNWPAGSMFSSINDLSRWVIAFMNDGRLEGRQVLLPSLIATVSAPRANIPGGESKYGYGLSLRTWRGVKIVEHSGSRSGYGSFIRMAPEQKVAIIILGNRTGTSLPKTMEKAASLFLPLSAPQARPEAIAMTEAEMRKYVGVYGEGSRRFEFMVKDGKLALKTGDTEVVLEKIGDSSFRNISGPGTYVFVAGPDGSPTFLHLGGRTMKKQ